MAKTIKFCVNENGTEHKITLLYSYLTGKAKINIDGDDFDISTRALRLRGTSQIFRLGEKQAILVFPKKGAPDIVVDGKYVNSGKIYES